MVLKLYFAPINLFGNYLFREMIENCDYIFSEMVDLRKLDDEINKGKLICNKKENTIFQVLFNNNLVTELNDILLKLNFIEELNLNACCPHCFLLKNNLGGGLLLNDLFSVLNNFSSICKEFNVLPSIKIRIGDRSGINLNKYLKIISKSNIKKVYIHFRTLYHPYSKPAIYTNELINIISKYENLDIILNGDINSFSDLKIKSKNIKGVMIGRNAIYNPKVFLDFYEKKLVELNYNDYIFYKKNLDKDYILRFIKRYLKKSNNLRINLIKGNLNYLLKGFKNANYLIKEINLCDSHKKIMDVVENDKKIY